MVRTTLDLFFSGLRKRRRIIAVLFILTLSSTTYLFTVYGVNHQGSDTATVHEGQYNLTISPTTIYFAPGSSSAEFQIYGNTPELTGVSVNITLKSGGSVHSLSSHVITNQNYTRVYVTVSRQEIGNDGGICAIEVSGSTIYSFRLDVSQSYVPVAADILIGTSIILYVLTILSFDFRRRWILPAIVPVYIAVAILFGQRYDTFFMMSSGIRLVEGVNPFFSNGLFPPSLKWEYTPLFLPYSSAVYIMSVITGLFQTTNQQLNFPGTVGGFSYMAWRAMNGKFLLPYYLLIKIPMILTTIGTYTILLKYSGIQESRLSVVWLLNPAVLLIGVAWGQLDVISAFFLIFSLIELRRSNTTSSAFLCSIGTGFKIFPVFLLPGILRESSHRIRDLAAFSAGLIPDLLLYYFSGFPLKSLYTLFYSRSIPTFYGVFSTNGVSWQNILTGLGISSFPSLFLYVFLPFYVLFTVYFISRKTNRDYVKYLITVFVVFFLTYNYVNPQYFIWVLPLMILSEDKRDIAIVSSVPLLYLFLTYNFASFVNPYLTYNYFSPLLGQVEVFRLSLVHFMIYPFIFMVNVYFVWLVIRMVKDIGRGEPSAPT